MGVKRNPDEKIFQKAQQIATGSGAADLLKVQPCPIQQDNPQRGQDDAKLQNTLSSSAASACQKINSIPNSISKNRIAQSVSPAPVLLHNPNFNVDFKIYLMILMTPLPLLVVERK